ncbi:hypothetical protein [Streptomyces sp. NPDC090036]|uniref:hypothetical protein n=1 Tax=Streptomyces sp. NPDC090036 TaxID=3365926 RepID=UPI003809418B
MMRRRAVADAEGAKDESAWAYPTLTLKWAERYYASERDLAAAVLDDIDALAAGGARASRAARSRRTAGSTAAAAHRRRTSVSPWRADGPAR